MNRLLLLTAISVGLACGCASRTELAEADETHALLEVLEQGDIDDSHFRAKLVRVDGAAIVPGMKRTYRIDPGTHTLGFILDVESVRVFHAESGRSEILPSESSANVREKQIEVTLEAGRHYLFGAEIEGFKYSAWRPYVVEND